MEKHLATREKNTRLRLSSFFGLLLLGWTAAVALSLTWNLQQHYREKLEVARYIARSHFDMDMLLRQWNISHGFVFAPVTEKNPPNPYLKIPERDVTTPSGKQLTALNSSYMLRQLHQLAAAHLEIKGHMTSLSPLRPENGPDPWEAEALKSLIRGVPEVSELKEMEGKPYLRLMRPVVTEAGCLKCHAGKGFQPGEVMGGISISVPMAPLWASGRRETASLWWGHGLLWLVGVAGLVFGARQLNAKIKSQQAVEARLARQTAIVSAINQVFQEALTCDTVSELALHSLTVAQELTASPLGFVGEINDQGRFDTLAISDTGWQACRLPKAEAPTLLRNMEIRGLWGEVIREGVPLLTNDPGAHPRRVGLPAGHPDLTAFLGVPLKYHDKIVGMIGLANKTGGYSADDQEAAVSLAAAVVEALARKRAELALKDSEAHLKVMMDGIGAGVLLVDVDTRKIVAANPAAAALAGVNREDMVGRRCLDFICSNESGQCPVIDLGVIENQAEHRLLTRDGKVVPILKTVVPVVLKGKKYLLESFLDLSDQRRTEEALSQANAQLQNMIYEFGRKNKETNLLSKLGEVLQSCQSLEEAYGIILQFIGEMFPGFSGGLFVMDNLEHLLTAVGLWGGDFQGDQQFAPEDCWALRRGRSHRLTDTTPRLVCAHLSPPPEATSLCVPLQAQGEILGLLVLLAPPEATDDADDLFLERRLALDESVQHLAERVAEQLSLSLANLKLRDTLRQQAIRDPLTGLYNRRYLQETLGRELKRARRQKTTLGVMFLDLDHFKAVNDTFGHDAGDLVLQTLANLLQNRVRQEDIPCRYGGEEFCLVMPDAPEDVVLQRAEDIRQAVQRLRIHHNGHLLANLPVSIGVACFPYQGETADLLLQAADAALYQAKETGRNRVVAAGGPAVTLAAPDGSST